MDVSVFRGLDVDNDSYFDWSDDDVICSSKYISSDEDDENFIASLKSTRSKRANKDEGKDDFEREMASELSQTMQNLTAAIIRKKTDCTANEPGSTQKADGEKTSKTKDPEDVPEFYDDIYFDSDESETEDAENTSNISGTKRKKEKRRILSNDELFYDPTLDDKDQEWVDRKRRSYQPKKKRQSGGPGTSGMAQPLPQSDAVLNCPACLTTLCMDCQRHQIYHNQYRAMFVFNCSIDTTERLKYPTKGQKKKNFLRNKRKNKNKQQQEEAQSTSASSEKPEVEPNHCVTPQEQEMEVQESPDTTTPKEGLSVGSAEDELFYPVRCKICNTKVAVYDVDEVYHFFNIVTSY